MAKRVREVECPLCEKNTGDDECPHIVRGKHGIHGRVSTHTELFIPIPVVYTYIQRYTQSWVEANEVLQAAAKQGDFRDDPLGEALGGCGVNTDSPLLTQAVAVVLGDLTRDDVSCLYVLIKW